MKRIAGTVFGVAMAFGVLPVHADIFVDGVNHGSSYALTGKATSVSIDSGVLTIGDKGMVNGDLQIFGGEVFIGLGAGNVQGLALHGGQLVASGGNIHQPTVYAGMLTFDGDAKVLGGLSLQGGTSLVTKVDKINGGIDMNNDAMLFMEDVDVNGVLSVQGDAIAYFSGGYLTDSTINPSGKVVDTQTGSLTGLSGSMTFNVEPSASLYVGAIPEPAVLPLVLLASGGYLLIRRRGC